MVEPVPAANGERKKSRRMVSKKDRKRIGAADRTAGKGRAANELKKMATQLNAEMFFGKMYRNCFPTLSQHPIHSKMESDFRRRSIKINQLDKAHGMYFNRSKPSSSK